MRIGKNIRHFRLQKGLSQQWLADALGVSKMSISYFENDKRRPDIETVKRICSALDVDCSESALPKDKILMSDSAADATTYMRKALGLPASGPVGNLIQVLENKGICITTVKQDSSEVSTKGFSGYHAVSNKGFAVIAFSTELTYGCQRLTIAKELAYLLFSDVSERQISNAARHFLLPGPDLVRGIGEKRPNISPKEIGLVGDKYGVPGQCVVLRAKEEGIITRETYNHIQSGKLYPPDVYKKDEMPVRILQLVCRAYTDNLIGISKAAELLNTDVSHALELCEGKENR